MTRYADELRGSETERCIVIGLLNGEVIDRPAVVLSVHDGGNRATVKYDDDGTEETLTFERVTLQGDEDVRV